MEVLGFIIGLIGSDGNGLHADLNVFGLELMNVALNAGGPGSPCEPSSVVSPP